MNYYIYSGTISADIILAGNSMYIYSGGVANNATINADGVMQIWSSGGVANSTTVNSRGCIVIRDGGTASSTTLNSSGYMNILERGVVNNTTVNLSGSMRLSSGGTANSTTVNSGGCMLISGGVANSTTIESKGEIHIYSGGTATNIIASSGADLGIIVASDTYIQGTSAGSAFEMKNASISGYTVDSSGYILIEGGTATSTTVNNGNMHISSGVANNTTVNAGGYMTISGGTANSTTVNSSGRMYISLGGVANNTTVCSGGDMYISAGGTATNIIWTPCEGEVNAEYGAYVTYASGCSGVYFGYNDQLLSHTDSMTGKVFYYGSMYVMSGGEANSTTVNGGYMYIYSGGMANSTTVNNGLMLISSGGTATNIIWTPCVGKVNAQVGAYVTYASSYSGVYFGSDNHLLSHTDSMTEKVVSGSMYVMSGGVANSTTVISRKDMYILSGGVANSTKLNYGSMHISSGGIANSTTVTSYGIMYISCGGVANNTTINDGHMYISGGVANNTTLSDYDRIYIHSGGTANSTTLCDSLMFIYSGGVANNTTNSGTMYISCGGVANGTIVSSSGRMYISSGGTANSTTVQSKGAPVIYSGGTANSTTVQNQGYLIISSGGTHRGSLQIESGAVVSAYSGSIIDFTVSDRTASDGYLINKLSLISGTPTYTITVSANQASGTYKLAQGAKNFTGSISVGDGSVDFGTLRVNGSELEYNAVSYSLILSGGNLALKVDSKLVITGNPADWTNQDVTLCASANEDNCVFQYSFDNSTWLSGNTVTVSENKTVYFKVTDAAGNVTEKSVVVDKIDKTAAPIPEIVNISNTESTITVDWKDVADNASGITGYYIRCGNSANLTGDGKFVTESIANITSVAQGKWFFQVQSVDAAGNRSNWSETATFEIASEPVLSGDKNGLSFTNVEGWKFVELSQDDFLTRLQLLVEGDAIDFYNTPDGSYQWQICSEEIIRGNDFVSDNPQSAQEFISDADGDTDVFFADISGVWDNNYIARHMGELEWGSAADGKLEYEVFLEGKNRIDDVFSGSTDANILLLSDTCDALFLDDIYTALGDQARVSSINEIRAGDGNDLIDLTSTRYTFGPGQLIVYGGEGCDILWGANDCQNILFGGHGDDQIIGGNYDDILVGNSGSDILHGGGGNDIFYFEQGPHDAVVMQESDGGVILWIENGSIENWDEETLTYTDDNINSHIQVVGGAHVTLEFGSPNFIDQDQIQLSETPSIWN